MNSMNVPSKRSTFEKKLDKLILALFSTLFTMCVIGAIGRLSFFRSIFWSVHNLSINWCFEVLVLSTLNFLPSLCHHGVL